MRYDFKVKADAKGKFFLTELRANLNRNKCYLRVRANGNRTKHAIADGLHLEGMIKTYLSATLKNIEFT